MIALRRKHRWFGMGFLIAWAMTHCVTAFAQNEPAKVEPARPSPADKIRRTLDQVIALEYQGNSFNDAIGHLKDRTQLPVVVDQIALQQMGLADGAPVNVELRNVRGKVRQALQHLLSNHNLTYVILEDSLLITTEEAAVNRQMRQRVPIELNAVKADKALRDVAKQTGVNLVIDPRVAKKAAEAISLQLDDASVETSLRLIAELVDLKAVRMGNVMFVTDAARAERIRAEERVSDDGRPMIFERPGFAVPGAPGINVAPAIPVPAPPPVIEQPRPAPPPGPTP